MKKKNKNKKPNQNDVLFQVIDDDPRLAGSVDVEETIPENIDDLFKVVGTSDERAERLDSTPYSYWRLTFSHLFKNPLVIVQILKV